MVKKTTPLVNQDVSFKGATDVLFTPVSHDELAEELGCSVALIRQARRDPKSPSFRNAPAGWEVTVRQLLRDKADHFSRLANRLTVREQDH